MTKIRAQIMMEENVYLTLKEMQINTHAKNLSIFLNKLLEETFKFSQEREKYNQQIEELKDRAQDLYQSMKSYRSQVLEKQKIIDELKGGIENENSRSKI